MGNRCCCPVTICGWGVREFSHPSRPCSRGRHNGSNFRDLLPAPAGKAGPADGSFSDAFGRSHRRQRRAFSSPFRRRRRSLCASCGPATSAPSRLVSLNKRSALGHAWLQPLVHRLRHQIPAHATAPPADPGLRARLNGHIADRLRTPPCHSGDSTITRTRNMRSVINPRAKAQGVTDRPRSSFVGRLRIGQG